MIPLLGTHGLFLLIAGIGAIAGSVANMLIYRLPRDLPIGMERSRCTTCNTPLTPLDLIPILSYLGSRGRCRHCHGRIARRYLLVEVICVGIGLGIVHLSGISLQSLYWASIAYVALLITVIDFETQLIPNSLSLILGIIGVAGHWVIGMWAAPLLSGLLAGGGMWALTAITTRIYKRPTFGGGDTKLMAALGTILGGIGAGYALYFGFILGGFAAIPLLLAKRKGRRDKMAFGPFIIMGAVAVTIATHFAAFEHIGWISPTIQHLP